MLKITFRKNNHKLMFVKELNIKQKGIWQQHLQR